MKVAVTGASGMLGGFVVAALAGHEVVAIDRVARTEHDTVIVDMLNRAGLAAALDGCKAVIHLAAIDQARVATEDEFYEVNVIGTWNVLSTAERLGLRRVVICSSVAALGLRPEAPPEVLPIPVDHPLRPVSAYGLSKQACETLAAGFAARGRLQVACLRPALVTFPHQIAEWATVAAEADGLPPPDGVPAVTKRVLEPLPLTRAYVGPEDAARAFAAALEADIDRLCCCYVTAGDTLSVRPTMEVFASSFRARPSTARPDHFTRLPQASPYDLEPARIALGWQPRDRWRDIVARHALGGAGG